MPQPEATRVSSWIRLRSFTVHKQRAIRLSAERRSFEHKIEATVRAALAHQSGGLPAGNRQYKLLRQQADSLSGEFARRWNIDPNLLDAQIPAIGKLKALADPPPKPSPTALLSLGVVVATAVFFLIGILAGLTTVGYHLVGGH